MEAVFLKVLNMSVTAGYVIVAVLLLRLPLRKLPKKVSYLLWSVVAFRLCCPVTWQSVFSLFSLTPGTAASVQVAPGGATRLEHIPGTLGTAAPPQASTDIAQVSGAINSALPAAAPVSGADPVQLWITVGTVVWCAGMAALLIYSMVCYAKMCRQMRTAVLLRENIYQSDCIRSPFLLGFVHPKIYIPFGLDEETLNYVLEHERYHIRRRDYLIKPFAFLLLTVHWFNPFCWLAFHLMGRDMEMSCDEKVIAGNAHSIKAYSTSLLSFAVNRHFPAPSPLAFGEASVKSRIKNVLKWKKPKTWATLLGAVLCVLAVVACAANPEQAEAGDQKQTGRYVSMEDFAEQTIAAADGSYYSVSKGGLTTAGVLETKLEYLEKTGEVSALAPNGTLESWRFGYLVRIDADADDIALPGGMHEENGWYDLEGQGGHNVVALRYEDGSYDILYDEPVNDGMDFFGYHYSCEEAIYDWYVKEYGLDLPLYVIDLLPYDELGNHPAHRYDGDGWYLYIPIQAWELTEASEAQTAWSSQYGTGSMLAVRKASASEMAMSRPWIEGQAEYYFESPNGAWCVFTAYYPENITDYPYIAIEPDVLKAMAESFTLDARFINPAAPDGSAQEGPAVTLPADFSYTERTGRAAVLTEDAALTNCFSFTYSDPDDISTYQWISLQNCKYSAGDVLLVLAQADGVSRVMVPYGDFPRTYGFVSSDLLSMGPADIEQGNQAIITDCDCYDSVEGSVIQTGNAWVNIKSNDGAWACVEEYGTGAEPYWVHSGDLSFVFDGLTVWDLPDSAGLS